MVTKEEVFKNLKAKLVNNQKISDRTINETLDTLIVGALETEDDSTFSDRIFPVIDTLNRNLIKDNSDAINDYIAKNPPANKREEQNKQTPPKTPEPQGFEELQRTLLELSQKVERQEKMETLNSKKRELRELLTKTHKIDEKWSDEYITMFPIQENDDITQLSTKALEFYNLSIASVNSDTSPLSPDGRKKPIDINADFSDIVKLKQETN